MPVPPFNGRRTVDGEDEHQFSSSSAIFSGRNVHGKEQNDKGTKRP